MAKKPKRMWVYGTRQHPICCAGPPNNPVCHNLSLLEAAESEFHDDVLKDATQEINGILERARERHGARETTLHLIDTSLGLMLVWAEPDERPESLESFITYDSGEDTIRDALGLPPEPAEKAGRSA